MSISRSYPIAVNLAKTICGEIICIPCVFIPLILLIVKATNMYTLRQKVIDRYAVSSRSVSWH